MNGINYRNAEQLREHFPFLDEATIQKIVKMKGRGLGRRFQNQITRLLTAGYVVPDICAQLRIPKASFLTTKLCFPVFAAECAAIEKARKCQVESVMFRLATGKTKIVKKTYVTTLDADGMPKVDEFGKTKMTCIKKEVTTVPANVQALMWWLQQHYPEKYGGKRGEIVLLPPEQLVEKLEEAVANLCSPIKIKEL